MPVNICIHGQEFYCRICGTIEHRIVKETPALLPNSEDTKVVHRDYNNERGQAVKYYKHEGD